MYQTIKKQQNPLMQAAKTLMLVLALTMAFMPRTIPMSVYASTNHSRHYDPAWRTMTEAERWNDPNWRNLTDAERWNFRHNWGYHAPTYQFQTTWPVDQWGRPTTSNVAPDRTNQNIRSDRHASVTPPPHGSTTGFFSGEFSTNPINPFAPRYNNNPNASHVVGVNTSVFALQPGETGVNVTASGNQSGGMLANTSIIQGGSSTGNPGASDMSNPAGQDGSPWDQPGTQQTNLGDSSGKWIHLLM